MLHYCHQSRNCELLGHCFCGKLPVINKIEWAVDSFCFRLDYVFVTFWKDK